MLRGKISDIFFDLDHTLWDFEKNSALTFERLLTEYGVDIPLDTFLKAYIPINLQYWRMYRNGSVSKETLRYERLKFTLKLTMAMRIADVDAGTAQAKFNEARSGAIASVNENINYPYLTEDTNDNPWQDRFETREDYALSSLFVDHLSSKNDPRLAQYGELPVAGGDYTGIDYGIENPNVNQTNVSFIDSDIIYDGTQKGGAIFTYAQVAFSIAEAAQRGWTSDSAEDWYNKGIQASMDQWGVSATDATAYLAEASVKFDTSKAMEQIATEKWVSLFLQGSEAW
ncbi:SusD/RagB family nutrient-binding outer membrane lipoprotein, partial [Flavobacteriaceae bacterium]|nr:SusD/RagB family nutrient-binding outer membrane lipoprotein [Flavobacteriaceae bacterium]